MFAHDERGHDRDVRHSRRKALLTRHIGDERTGEHGIGLARHKGIVAVPLEGGKVVAVVIVVREDTDSIEPVLLHNPRRIAHRDDDIELLGDAVLTRTVIEEQRSTIIIRPHEAFAGHRSRQRQGNRRTDNSLVIEADEVLRLGCRVVAESKSKGFVAALVVSIMQRPVGIITAGSVYLHMEDGRTEHVEVDNLVIIAAPVVDSSIAAYTRLGEGLIIEMIGLTHTNRIRPFVREDRLYGHCQGEYRVAAGYR